MGLHPRSPTTSGANPNNQPTCITEPPTPLRRAKLKTDTHVLLPLMNSLFQVLCWESFHLKVHPTALPEREKTDVKPVSEAKNICRCLNIFLHTRNWQIPASWKFFWLPTIIIVSYPANWCSSIHLFRAASDKCSWVPSLWQMTSLLLKGFLWEQCCRGHSML